MICSLYHNSTKINDSSNWPTFTETASIVLAFRCEGVECIVGNEEEGEERKLEGEIIIIYGVNLSQLVPICLSNSMERKWEWEKTRERV